MGKVTVFNFVSVNGYFAGPGGDISWAHDSEENDFAAESLQADGILLFGRVTYELMVKYWPTPQAMKDAPAVAEGMNKAEKIVFSRTLKKVDWQNTRVIGGNIVEETRKLKETSGKDMTILGSGSIVTQFADQDLIDEYQLMVHPVALGDGIPFLKGIKQTIKMKTTTTRPFKSGLVLHCYVPVGKGIASNR